MIDPEACWIALGEPNRLRLFRLLLERPLCVTELTRVTGFGQSLVSHHLGVLLEAGCVEPRRRGRRKYFHPHQDGTPLAPLARWIRQHIDIPEGWAWPGGAPLPAGERPEPGNDMEDYLL